MTVYTNYETVFLKQSKRNKMDKVGTQIVLFEYGYRNGRSRGIGIIPAIFHEMKKNDFTCSNSTYNTNNNKNHEN